jgi:hypothetical protein
LPVQNGAGESSRLGLAGLVDRETFPIVVVSVCAMAVFWLATGSVGSDTWLSLVAGREIADHGLPHTEHLTVWASGRDWVDQQWLAQLLLYAVHQAGGIVALAVLNAAVVVASFALAVAAARRLGGSATAVALIAVPPVLVLLPYTGVRAQPLTYPLFVALFWLLVREARAPSWRVALAVPLLVLWANLHGSVVLAAGLVALLGVCEAVELVRRPRPLASVARVAGLLFVPWLLVIASPYAGDLPGYYRDVLWNPAFRDVVTEWARPTLGHDWPFFLLAVAGGVLIGLARRRFTLFEKLAFLALVLAGLSAARNAVWLVFAFVILAPRALDALWRPAGAPRRPAVNVVLATAVAGCALVAAGATAARPASDYQKAFPAAAGRAVSAAAARDPGERVFANERYADWLLWRDPSLAGRVAFDARLELLTGDEIRSIAAFRGRVGPDWRRAARGYGILLLGTEDDARPIRGLARDPGVRPVYRDRRVTVLRR